MIKSPMKVSLRRSARLRRMAASNIEAVPVDVLARSDSLGSDDGRKDMSMAVRKPHTGVTRGNFPNRVLEQALQVDGFKTIAGVDEAGRGPLAGPVVAGACIIPPHVHIAGIRDSKKMTAAQREEVYQELLNHPEVLCATQVIEAEVIDEINILQATLRAMELAVSGLGAQPDFVLIDGNQQPKGISSSKSRLVVRGDATCQVIAAASILAKVVRDRLMLEYDKVFPSYGFGQHKGYGTAKHMAALKLHGSCPIHRQSYKPVADAIDLQS